MQLDIDRLVAYFGGVNALAEALKQHDPENAATTAAIYKWRTRGSLPLAQLQKLTALAEAQGRPLDLNAFLQKNESLERTEMTQTNRVIIFDTTMRDGEQSPGASMTKEEKIRIARQLEKMGVDVIEAGFAAASPGDFESVNAIAKIITKSTVCSLARAVENDVRKAGEAVAPAPKKRIHTFIATSPIHMEHKLKMKPQQVIDAAVKAVKIAKEYTDDVEFSAEDAVRSDLDFLAKIFTAVIEAGATTINIPDTVGYSIPSVWYERISNIIKSVPNGDKIVWSTHCHNDLGMAVANSLAAVQAGVRQVECTINGLGERAGNASLEEIVMALKVRHDLFGLETGIDTTQIVPVSKLVSTITGYPIQPNKAVVGANAFAHESGIHQDGVLKHPETYEIMTAESVGWSTNRLTLGKLSGRNAFKTKLADLGIELESEEALNAAFARFKELADKKREIFDEDLHALVSDEMGSMNAESYKFISQKISTETGEEPRADIVFSIKGEEKRASATGSGPVDAIFKAIESVAQSGATLQIYSVNAVTQGTESQGETSVRLARGNRVVNAAGRLGVPQVRQQQGHGADGRGRVGDSPAGDVRRRAVNGLEHRRVFARRIDVRGGRQADAPRDRRGQVRDDVAEQIVGDDHVEPGRVDHHGDHGGVDVQVVARDIGELLTYLIEEPTPQAPGVDQDVVLVQQGDPAAPRPGACERVTNHPFHPERGVDGNLGGDLLGGAGPHRAAIAAVEPLGSLTYHHEVDVAPGHDLGGQGGGNPRVEPRRPQVHGVIEGEPQPQQQPSLQQATRDPVRTGRRPDRPEQDGVRGPQILQRGVGQDLSGAQPMLRPEIEVNLLEGVFARGGPQYLERLGGYLRADAVAANNCQGLSCHAGRLGVPSVVAVRFPLLEMDAIAAASRPDPGSVARLAACVSPVSPWPARIPPTASSSWRSTAGSTRKLSPR